MNVLSAIRTKMEQANVSETAIKSFERNVKSLINKETGMIREADITAVESLPESSDFSRNQGFSQDLLAKTVVIKLNGGLGTSMGLQKSKTLLNVKSNTTFLDIIVNQIIHLRETTEAKVEFLLMNSFSTSKDTLDHLEQYEEHGLSKAEDIEMLQNQAPKLNAETLLPATHEENPELEWCPPGHGDLYAAIAGSGWLDELIERGVEYAFVSNADNLGAVLDADILNYFASSNHPFLMEATKRTEADKKGGHLAIRTEDNQLLLREVAQCEDNDLGYFQDTDRHQYFNTNNLWIKLSELRKALEKHDGSLPLPMIRNSKTIDPRDKNSTPVYQLEIAMGSAIECFENAGAICVPRSRFAPVKTTADLFALRSDAYETTEDGRIALVASRNGKPPVINLGPKYKLVDSLEGLGTPSLKKADKITIEGPIRFAENVVIEGNVTFINESNENKWVASGLYKNETVTL